MTRLLLLLVSVVCWACSPAPAVIDPGPKDAGIRSECVPGAQFCNGPTLWICRTDGEGYTQIPCELGCENAHCASESCTPNQKRCLEPKLAEACDATGQAELQVCDHGCADGQCVAIQCVAGKLFCSESGSEVQKCSVDGLQILDVETCNYGCDAVNAVCLAAACDEGDLRCSPEDPLRVQQCNPEQTAFDDTNVLCTETCDKGICYVSACTPSSLRCGPSALEECKSDGSGFVSKEECQWGCLDNGQGEAFCALCLPGAYACKDNNVVFCAAPQQPWTVVKECNSIDSCVQGDCVKVISLSDEQTKKETNLLLIQAFVDCWQKMNKADKEADLCRSISSVELSIGIDKGDLIDWFCEGLDDTIDAEDLGGESELDAAKDLMGCGGWILNPNNLTFKTPGEKINPGLWLVECVAYDDGEILVSPCALVKK